MAPDVRLVQLIVVELVGANWTVQGVPDGILRGFFFLSRFLFIPVEILEIIIMTIINFRDLLLREDQQYRRCLLGISFRLNLGLCGPSFVSYSCIVQLAHPPKVLPVLTAVPAPGADQRWGVYILCELINRRIQ